MKKIKNKVLNSFLLLLVGLALFPTMNVKAANYNDMIIERSQWTNDYITKISTHKDYNQKYKKEIEQQLLHIKNKKEANIDTLI